MTSFDSIFDHSVFEEEEAGAKKNSCWLNHKSSSVKQMEKEDERAIKQCYSYIVEENDKEEGEKRKGK